MQRNLVKTMVAFYLIAHVCLGYELGTEQSNSKWVLFIMFVVLDAWFILSWEYGEEENDTRN